MSSGETSTRRLPLLSLLDGLRPLTRGRRGPRASRPSTYRTTAGVLRVAIGLVYLLAFVSLLVQLRGLLGADGSLPAGTYLDLVRRALGRGLVAWLRVPTLAWLAPGDGGLVALCLAGAGSSLLLTLGLLPFASALASWLLYLSLTVVGQDFLSFQWDILLLEAGFLLLFLVPLGWRAGLREEGPWFGALWLFWWLLFRLILESGAVKLASGDPTWRDLSAMTFHYHTQPIPNLVAWYADQLPLWFQKLSTLVTFLVELPLPFLFFLRRRPRMLGGVLVIAHQCLILATGNFGFFNLLTIAIALSLFDDLFWYRLLLRFPRGRRVVTRSLRSERRRRKTTTEAARRSLSIPELVRRGATVCFLIVAVTVGTGQLVRAAGRDHVPGVVLRTWGTLQPFFVLNSYGLFATMTTTRPELVLEARRSGGPWQELDFRWKADDPSQRPRQVAPYMPRLDWQLWFAALTAESGGLGAPRQAGYDAWLLSLVERLLAGAPRVWGLLSPRNPFRAPDGGVTAPDEIRILLYDYRFTTSAERSATGAWWSRREIGEYLPPVRRTDEGRLELATPPTPGS